MNQPSFATRFEKIIKPRIAKQFNLYPLGQCFNGDYITQHGDILELKLRKIRECKGEGFVASKKQYLRIKNSMGQAVFDNNGKHHLPNFSYMFLPYFNKETVKSVTDINEYIRKMEIPKVFIADHTFLPENDKSGKESTFYRVLMDEMEKNVAQSKKVDILGTNVPLEFVGYAEYLPDLASRC